MHQAGEASTPRQDVQLPLQVLRKVRRGNKMRLSVPSAPSLRMRPSKTVRDLRNLQAPILLRREPDLRRELLGAMNPWLAILRHITAPEASGRAACISIPRLRRRRRSPRLQNRPLLSPSELVVVMPPREARRLSSRALDSDAHQLCAHLRGLIERQIRAPTHPVLCTTDPKGTAAPVPRPDGTAPILYLRRLPANLTMMMTMTTFMKCDDRTGSNPRLYPRADSDLIRSSPTSIDTRTPAPDMVRPFPDSLFAPSVHSSLAQASDLAHPSRVNVSLS